MKGCGYRAMAHSGALENYETWRHAMIRMHGNMLAHLRHARIMRRAGTVQSLSRAIEAQKSAARCYVLRERCRLLARVYFTIVSLS